ncbi:CYTH and CHAD domain-containing protein [Cryobacterium breve]|uniref:CYTH and CHAD domain-containing protein n=2 Tax=Cryobacterium TaxID=69578 RepID=A0ABY7NCC0_9MICO|nr:CYTH and CHAD domain-containing protein [Cryobacterium breve]WBM79647.1 CYTH and CHAD domain-containing protein [Cryobacterium breve]
MNAVDFSEVERKYDVDAASVLPPLQDLPGVTWVDAPVEHSLDAVYFDTADLTLAAHRITLRRRTGGDDAGWHLKLPSGVDGRGPDERREVHEPLGSDPELVPAGLQDRVRVLVRDGVLVPVVRLRNHRIVHVLRGETGAVLAEVCDDSVQADRLAPDPLRQEWREWEIELVEGTPELLDAVADVFAAGGVRRAGYPSKLGRALGDRIPADPPAPPAPPSKSSTTGALLLAYLDAQMRVLVRQDPLVRRDDAEAVHQMRVATRRMRSVLATYRDLLPNGLANTLGDELQWIARVLGAARDNEVLHHNLARSLSSEPAKLVVGHIKQRLDTHFAADLAAAQTAAETVLDSPRYFRLLDALDAVIAEPPFTALAKKPARTVVPGLVKRDGARLRKAVRAARVVPQGPDHDAALHEVRKIAKRLRYTTESALVLRPKRAARVVAAARLVQDILGEHHDSVVARGVLLTLGMRAFIDNENSFTYGRLHATEQFRGAHLESRFRSAWKSFPKSAL